MIKTTNAYNTVKKRSLSTATSSQQSISVENQYCYCQSVLFIYIINTSYLIVANILIVVNTKLLLLTLGPII